MLDPQRIPEIQQAIAEAGADAWLFVCFQNNDPVSLELLGLAGRHFVSRRCYYLIPRVGLPSKLHHRLEPAMLSHLPGEQRYYLTWGEHAVALSHLVSGIKRLVAQYSPDNQIPNVSRLDAGTAEFLRGRGVELVSSADLVQRFAATWSPAQLAGHRRACTHLHEIVRSAFDRVFDKLRAGGEDDELAVQQFILERFEAAGLWAEDAPIVGVNAHSADPHYRPGPGTSSSIKRGDFLLIDLFAKEKAEGSVYADITWCGVCAPAPTERQQEIFRTVAAGRDAAVELVTSRYPHTTVRGYEVDDAARGPIVAAGYGEKFIHRTGHSIGMSDHGQGANMDNLETHDTRPLLPMTGFSIEPGIYFEGDFGVRLEINVALTPEKAEVTGAEPQRELLRL
ncbi:MAG TPA: Xaa-Pro peptidase family protein [Thermoanaerobaculia bacterium]|jgi:Xaa-Pro aminopeptidase|nr:Xaa-Pro peptidase family protein [Thermoanaerobaculia bacterium]